MSDLEQALRERDTARWAAIEGRAEADKARNELAVTRTRARLWRDCADELAAALRTTSFGHCDCLSHDAPSDRHGEREACPVAERNDEAMEQYLSLSGGTVTK
jgi:hypothetical protein